MKVRGFSLLELLVVISIIGILSSMAIPAYQTYVIRTNVIEGIRLSTEVKSAIYDYYSKFGTWPASNSVADIPLHTSLTGNATRSITINNGLIIITYRTQVGSGQTLVYTPTINNIGSIEWQCKTGSTIPTKYRPYNCR